MGGASGVDGDAKTLDAEDLWAMPPNDRSKVLFETFQTGYEEAKAKASNKASKSGNVDLTEAAKKKIFVSALIRVLGRRFFIAGFIARFVNSSLQFTFPIFLAAIITYIETGEIFGYDVSATPNLGYALAAGLGLAMMGKAVCENAYFHVAIRGGWQMRSAVTAAVYQKSLRLSAAARQEKTLGEMVNFMQIDGMKLEMFAPQIHVLWDGIYQIVGYMAVLINYIGASALVGLVVMVLSMPLQLIIMKRLFGMNRIMAKHTDARVKVVNEALQGMQCVKMYSWEDNFFELDYGPPDQRDRPPQEADVPPCVFARLHGRRARILLRRQLPRVCPHRRGGARLDSLCGACGVWAASLSSAILSHGVCAACSSKG